MITGEKKFSTPLDQFSFSSNQSIDILLKRMDNSD